MERATPTPREGLPIGRAALLGTDPAGVAGIAVAPAIAGAVTVPSPRLAGLADVRPGPDGGWRIYACTPRCRASIRRRPPGRHGARRASRGTSRWSEVPNCPASAGLGLPLRDRVVGGRRPLGGLPPAGVVRPRAAAPRRIRHLESLDGGALRRHARCASCALPDAMLARPHGRQAAAEGARAPLRLVIPRCTATRTSSGSRELRFDRRSAGYWEQRGYDTDAWVGRSNGYG